MGQNQVSIIIKNCRVLFKRFFTLGLKHDSLFDPSLVLVRLLNHVLQFQRLHVPDLEGVVHPAGENEGSRGVNVGTQNLVPVTLHSTKYGDAHRGLEIPEPQCVV